ncbi:MAG: hypothetical protein M3439_08250 [Chloroflexota bacterium]|nr:hypothetical protein [Chloroflexota bacterium]
MNVVTRMIIVVALVASALSSVALAAPGEFEEWSVAQRVESIPGTDPSFNGPAIDGCPFVSSNGKSFFMASNREGGLGGIDIWVSMRDNVNDPWGAPVNVGAPLNSAANDFCPTPARGGHLFYFVSNRDGGCGGDDIYVTRLKRDGRSYGWGTPENLGCDVNSAANEASPMPIRERGSGPVLYFSSNRLGGFATEPADATIGDSDIYVSRSHGGVFGPAELVLGVNSASEDGHPNISRDGTEMFFFSTQPGTLGMADIYWSTRSNTSDTWSTPVNLGPNVNSADAETRPSLSWDGTTLYFGSTRPGGEGASDIYVTTRSTSSWNN